MTTAGRPRGLQNVKTLELKTAFNRLLERNQDNMIKWLDQVAEKDPAKALSLMADFAEYCIPKLARSEINGNMKLSFEPLVIQHRDDTKIANAKPEMIIEHHGNDTASN